MLSTMRNTVEDALQRLVSRIDARNAPDPTRDRAELTAVLDQIDEAMTEAGSIAADLANLRESVTDPIDIQPDLVTAYAEVSNRVTILDLTERVLTDHGDQDAADAVRLARLRLHLAAKALRRAAFATLPAEAAA